MTGTHSPPRQLSSALQQCCPQAVPLAQVAGASGAVTQAPYWQLEPEGQVIEQPACTGAATQLPCVSHCPLGQQPLPQPLSPDGQQLPLAQVSPAPQQPVGAQAVPLPHDGVLSGAMAQAPLARQV